MIPKNSVKPLELVISALHFLKERKGSSPQNVLKYLVEKYNVNAETIRSHVQSGLKRGLSFGLITQKSGLYRLNDVLSSPWNSSEIELSRKKNKFSKSGKGVKKKKGRAVKKRKRKYGVCAQSRGRRKYRKAKERKDKKKKKPGCFRINPKRVSNETKRRKQTRRKFRSERFPKANNEKVKKILLEDDTETPPLKSEDTAAQCNNANNQGFELKKSNLKA